GRGTNARSLGDPKCGPGGNRREKRTAAPVAFAEPVAFELADADCSACTVRLPVVDSGAEVVCVPMAALGETIEIATATTGVIASLPAPVVLAPFSASTTEAWPPLAETTRLRAPTRTASLPTAAVVLSTTTDTAIERPRPNFAPVAPPERAFVVEALLDAAVTETSAALPPSVTRVPLPMAAVVDART